jgi:hypothetical protein
VKARDLAMLALGVDIGEREPDMVVAVVLDALHAEAQLMSAEEFQGQMEPRVLMLAHAKRIKALSALLVEHMSVAWRDDGRAVQALQPVGAS